MQESMQPVLTQPSTSASNEHWQEVVKLQQKLHKQVREAIFRWFGMDIDVVLKMTFIYSGGEVDRENAKNKGGPWQWKKSGRYHRRHVAL